MNYDAHMLLWENAHIKVKHIECVVNTSVQKKEVMKYSSLLIITVGEADIIIGDRPYQVQRFSIFHIGKSQTLHIQSHKPMNYFLIHYKGEVLYLYTLFRVEIKFKVKSVSKYRYSNIYRLLFLHPKF